MMNHPISKTIAFLAVIVVLFGLPACSMTGLPIINSTQENSQNTVLFQDDFADPASGWSTINNQNLIMGYDNGRFRMWINQTNVDTWSVANLAFNDTQIEVDAGSLDGPSDNDIGIICRYSNPGDFYSFLISSDGYYGISKHQDGNYQILGMEKMKFSPIINQGSVMNHIQADCVGNSLTLYVNQQQLISVEDPTFTTGDVGLLAGSYDQPGVDVIFDNFVVKNP
jgi:hypothetical protein